MRDFSIGELSKMSGVKVPTIRFYEQIGLLPTARRSEANRRVYGDDEARRLRFIRHCRELGFEIDDIRALLDLAYDSQKSCAEADGIARKHLDETERRIAQLTALRDELHRMIEQCGHGRIAECRVIECLDDHANCVHHERTA